jgi:hypothetical protein
MWKEASTREDGRLNHVQVKCDILPLSELSNSSSDPQHIIYHQNRRSSLNTPVASRCVPTDGTDILVRVGGASVAMSPCFSQSSHSPWLRFRPPLAGALIDSLLVSLLDTYAESQHLR